MLEVHGFWAILKLLNRIQYSNKSEWVRVIALKAKKQGQAAGGTRGVRGGCDSAANQQLK